MATGRHECSICMDTFKNPKLISCHHSFCYKCLDDYIQVNLRNGRFDCPICRASVELPKSGVSGFQSNFYIEETDTSDKFYCDLCGPKNAASSRCLDCEENLCQSCCHAHEKSKGTRHHKICDMGTLDPKTKGQIRQRIFCDQHPADEIRLFCRDCKVLICVICKVVSHEIHDTKLVDDVAAEMKKTLQTKLNECSDKLRRIDASKQRGDELDTCINDAEMEELKAVEDQHSQLNKMLDQKVANIKARIKNVYQDLRQQNAVFIRDMQDDFKTCSNAKDNAQNLVDHGTVIDIIKKCPDLEKLVSAVISKTDKTPNTRLQRKLFSPTEIKPDELIFLVGILLDSTEISPEEREKPLREEREKLEREEREKALKEEREKKEREEREREEREEKQIKEWSQGMEAKVKALNEELFKTRKQHEEANANAITKGTKLTQAEKEIQALRNQIADYVAQSQRMEARVKALEEGLSSTRKQYEEAKANSQGMETSVKALNEELFKTRKQHEEANTNAITKGTKLTQAEIEIQALRNQIADYVAQEEREKKEREDREKKEREKKQIQACRSFWGHDEYPGEVQRNEEDEWIKKWMCTRCQGWTEHESYGFNCKCGGRKN